MVENLSCPMAFVALLHLANEQNLQLTNIDDNSDIIITKLELLQTCMKNSFGNIDLNNNL